MVPEPPTPRRFSILSIVPWLLLAVACGNLGVATDPRPTEGGTELRLSVPELQLRSLLLLMADQQRFEPLTVESALGGSPGLRRQLALTLGRVGSARGVSYLNQLSADSEPTVRRAAVFALGELTMERSDAERAARALLIAVTDPDRETGLRAVEALGKLGVSVTEVARVLTGSEMSEEERWARLLPPLFRFDEEAAVALALGGLELASGDELRRWAVYGLTREPRKAALPEIRRLVADPDPRIRAWAARALGIVGGREDLPQLLSLLSDDEPAPRIQALRAGEALLAVLLEAGDDAGPVAEDWFAAHEHLLDDPQPHVRLEALDRACPWLALPRVSPSGESEGATSLSARLLNRLRDEGAPAAERASALDAVVCDVAVDAAELVKRYSDSPEPRLRAAAVGVLGAVRMEDGVDLLNRRLMDSAPAVRSAAAQALLRHLDDPPPKTPANLPEMPATGSSESSEGSIETLRSLLRVADPGVRAVAFAWLADHPILLHEDLVRATRASLVEANVETLLTAVKALETRATEVAEERGTLVAVLERLASRGDWLLRRASAAALRRLGRPAPPVGHPNLRRTPDLYEEIVQRTARPRVVEVETEAGSFRLRLDCPTTPLTCLNFLQLAGQGFFDGLTLHRLVPDFVVQGGDPRGDGYGGPGYTIRDEPNPMPFTPGTLGMARSASDTGGSQFFVTLSMQPHLDGAYTSFGSVIEGLDVLDHLSRGTRILRVNEVSLTDS